MLSFATFLARNTWFLVLHWMRRPWMRRMHLMPMNWLSGERSLKFYNSYKNQNRIARKIGLPLLKWAFFVLLASMILQASLLVALKMNEQGWLSPPKLEGQRITGE